MLPKDKAVNIKQFKISFCIMGPAQNLKKVVSELTKYGASYVQPPLSQDKKIIGYFLNSLRIRNYFEPVERYHNYIRPIYSEQRDRFLAYPIYNIPARTQDVLEQCIELVNMETLIPE